jgi:hypothetical protein
MLGLIIESVIGKKADEKFQEKIEEGGVPHAAAWLLAGVGATAVVSIGKKIFESIRKSPNDINLSRPVKVRWDSYCWDENDPYSPNLDDYIWLDFETFYEFQNYFAGLSAERQAQLISFWDNLPNGMQDIICNKDKFY